MEGKKLSLVVFRQKSLHSRVKKKIDVMMYCPKHRVRRINGYVPVLLQQD